MNSGQQPIQYTAKDIIDYLEDRLTPRERHALEKAALDDPFLAEAIEGFESMPAEQWSEQAGILKKELEQHITPARIIPMHRKRKDNRWRVAAGFLLILMGAAAVYLFNRDPKPHHLAGNKPATVIDSNNPTIVRDPNVPMIEPGKINTPQDQQLAVVKTIDPARSNQVPVSDPAWKKIATSPSDTDYRNLAINNAPVTIGNTTAAPAPVLNQVETAPSARKETAIAPGEQVKIAAQKNEADRSSQLPVRNFNAQVVAADNSPLPFANISVRSGNFDTYADARGNIRLLSPDSLLTVEVRSIGYQPRTYTLRSTQLQNKIVMSEDLAAVRERTVVKAKSSGRFISRRAMLLKDSIMNVEPADGWDNYNTYIANNIEIPEDILKNNIHGEVEISFDVKPNGTIGNIKVDKSLCDNCDEAVKRTLQQGPQWKVRKGKTPTGKVKVKF